MNGASGTTAAVGTTSAQLGRQVDSTTAPDVTSAQLERLADSSTSAGSTSAQLGGQARSTTSPESSSTLNQGKQMSSTSVSTSNPGSTTTGASHEIRWVLHLRVEDPQTFVTDPNVSAALIASCAEMSGQPQHWVSVSLSVVALRRLAAQPRRLAPGVKADFVIRIPAGESHSESLADEAKSKLASQTLASVEATLVNHLTSRAAQNIQSVFAMASPTITTEATQSTRAADLGQEMSRGGGARPGLVPLAILALLACVDKHDFPRA